MAAGRIQLDPRTVVARALQDIPTLPEVALRVLEATQDENTSHAEIERLLRADQAITAKVLRIANSAFYGLSTPIGSVNQALIVIGFNQIRKLVLALSAVSMFKARSARTRETLHQCWNHAYATGVAAQAIVNRCGFPPERGDAAFVGGILHDIGKVFLASTLDAYYLEVMRRAATTGMSEREAELALLKMDHVEVGHQLAKAWRAPQVVVDMITHHHGPLPAGSGVDVVAVYIASRIAENTEELPADFCDQLEETARTTVALTYEDYADIHREVGQQLSMAADTFGFG